MDHYILILSVLKAITVLLGVVFLSYTYRAYRKHKTRPLAVLILAIGLMTIAVVAEGLVFQAFGGDPEFLDQAHIVEAVFMLAAFAVLVYSVLVRDRRARSIESSGAPDEGFKE